MWPNKQAKEANNKYHATFLKILLFSSGVDDKLQNPEEKNNVYNNVVWYSFYHLFSISLEITRVHGYEF